MTLSSNIKIKKAISASYVSEGIACMLAVLPDPFLQEMGATSDMMSAIRSVRASGDYAGKAAAFFIMAIGTSPMTSSDRGVVGQVLGLGGSTILKGDVPTADLFLSEKVVSNPSWGEGFITFFENTSGVSSLSGDALVENIVTLMKYIDRYDSSVELGSNWMGMGDDSESSGESSGDRTGTIFGADEF